MLKSLIRMLALLSGVLEVSTIAYAFFPKVSLESRLLVTLLTILFTYCRSSAEYCEPYEPSEMMGEMAAPTDFGSLKI